MKKVLLLAQFFPPDLGGEERHVLNLSTALAARGHQVVVGTHRVPSAPAREKLDSGVTVHRISTSAMALPVYSSERTHHAPVPDPGAVAQLRRLIAEVRPDVVHAHNWIVNSALAALALSSGPRPPIVLTLHDYSHVCATKRLMREERVCDGPGMLRCVGCSIKHHGPIVGPITAAGVAGMRPWKSRGLDAVISVSNAVARANGVAGRPQSYVIPNFVPDDLVIRQAHRGEPDPHIPDREFVLYIGDLSQEKGLDVLLEAYAGLGAGRPQLLLVGRRTATTPASSSLPPGARMIYGWPHERVLAALRECLFCVAPSVWPDPCPTTVLEAMASGKAVITTRLGGMVDMVQDGRTGMLTTPGSVDELTAAMNSLVHDHVRRDELGKAALEALRPFTASTVAARVDDVYDSICAVRS